MFTKKKLYEYLKESKLLRLLRMARREYYLERHWRNIFQSMRKQTQGKDQLIPPVHKPGIAFSFDDSFRVEHWYKYGKDLFGYYDVKVTFNINAFHHFNGQREHTQEEIDMLLELQSHGHEIGHHGFQHKNAVEYSNEVGLDNWIEDDILPLIDWMDRQYHSKTKEKFKKPVTYAYPGSKHNDKTNNALVPKYFNLVRRGYLNEDNVISMCTSPNGFSSSICIDKNHLSKTKYIKKVIKIAKNTGQNLILMCHSVLPEETEWNDFGWGEESRAASGYRISPEMIQFVIEEAKKNDMDFYTTSEIAGIATFIDPRLERCIRRRLPDPEVKWILISDLHKIKELDLSNESISNLGGIEYLVNLEHLNLNNNNITDIRLFQKLPKLSSLHLANNPVKRGKLPVGIKSTNQNISVVI